MTTIETVSFGQSLGRLENHAGIVAMNDLIISQETETYTDTGLGYSETGLQFNPENLFAKELDQDPIESISIVGGGEGLFNVTVLRFGDRKFAFGRQVVEAAPDGEPDSGPLVMAELGPTNDIISIVEVWNPKDKDVLLEDPRALQAADGSAFIGFTVVNKAEGNKTYPAYMRLRSAEELLSGSLREPVIITKYGSGKQATPLSGEVESIGREVEGKNATSLDDELLMYRQNGENHTLQVLKCAEGDASHIGSIEFPKNIPWARYKIGTAAPPVWLNENEAFFEFHGLNKTIDGEVVDPDCNDPRVKYKYALGTARLFRTKDENGDYSFRVDNISIDPVLTSESFPDLGDDRQVELHPEIRQALYNCSGESVYDDNGQLVGREWIPSQGDMRLWTTMIAAGEIITGWDRTIPAEYHLAMAA